VLNGEITVELNQYESQQVTVLEIAGRVDSYSVPKLRTHLNKSVNRHTANLVVDLTRVNFIDSSGLAALVHAMRSCREWGGNLCLASPQRPVRMILELTRLDKAIDIFPSDSEAIASFATTMNSQLPIQE
jgi:anti-sigma B factor antagonist